MIELTFELALCYGKTICVGNKLSQLMRTHVNVENPCFLLVKLQFRRLCIVLNIGKNLSSKTKKKHAQNFEGTFKLFCSLALALVASKVQWYCKLYGFKFQYVCTSVGQNTSTFKKNHHDPTSICARNHQLNSMRLATLSATG